MKNKNFIKILEKSLDVWDKFTDYWFKCTFEPSTPKERILSVLFWIVNVILSVTKWTIGALLIIVYGCGTLLLTPVFAILALVKLITYDFICWVINGNRPKNKWFFSIFNGDDIVLETIEDWFF